MSEYMSLMDPLMAFTKKLSPEFPPLDSFMDSTKDFVGKTKTYVDEHIENLGAKIENTEQKLEKLEKLITFLEEHQAEL